MRQNGEMTDEKRLSLVEEYLSSGKSKNAFEKEKGLSQHCISNWIRTFAVEDNTVVIMPQSSVTDMKKDPDKEELLLPFSFLFVFFINTPCSNVLVG